MRALPNFRQRKDSQTQRNHHPERPNFVDEFIHAADRPVVEDIETGHQQRIIQMCVGEVGLVQDVQKIFALFQIENLCLENPERVGIEFERPLQCGEPAENPPRINCRQEQQQPQMTGLKFDLFQPIDRFRQQQDGFHDSPNQRQPGQPAGQIDSRQRSQQHRL